MDPISSPERDSQTPLSGASGQIVGPGGSILPFQAPVVNLPPLPTPSTGPAVTVTPSSGTVALAPSVNPSTDSTRPTGVGESHPPDSSVILPPSTASLNAMSYNETISSAKPSFIKKYTNKRALIVAAVPLLLLGSSAAAYFGYVAPNQPDNIWAKALSNTGKGYDKLSDYSQKQFFSPQYKGIKEEGSFKINGGFVADGDFHGVSSGDNGEFTGNLSASGVKLNMDLRTIKSTSGDTPDIYFKVSGLDGLASLLGGEDAGYSDLVKKVDGNWYFVDHTLLEQYAGGAGTNMKLTQTDVKSILDAVGSASKQNVFTTDQTKMAFQVKQKIGKEKQDGRNVYHFKVGVNKDNLKTYVTNLCANLKNSGLKKLFNDDSSELDSALDCKSIQDSVGSIKGDKTADAWVDMRTKLIHKVRFTDSNNSSNYFDIGQDYQGGDDLPFSMSVYDKEDGTTTTGSINVSLNMKTNVVTIKGALKETGDSTTSGSFNLTVTPNNEKVTVQKPDGAKNVLDLVNDLGFGDFISNDTSSNGADAERRTDINAMHGQVEAYQAENGFYPSLANMNDPNWVSANLVGMDPEALKDPSGSLAKLVTAPAANVYAYQASPLGCDNVRTPCTSYTLTATLNDGSTYVKQALNDDSTSASILN